MNAEKFLGIVRGKSKDSTAFRLGTIPSDHVSGRPKVLFDGETVASTRTYPYLSSYIPTANDRVLVAIIGHGFVVQGKVM